MASHHSEESEGSRSVYSNRSGKSHRSSNTRMSAPTIPQVERPNDGRERHAPGAPSDTMAGSSRLLLNDNDPEDDSESEDEEEYYVGLVDRAQSKLDKIRGKMQNERYNYRKDRLKREEILAHKTLIDLQDTLFNFRRRQEKTRRRNARAAAARAAQSGDLTDNSNSGRGNQTESGVDDRPSHMVRGMLTGQSMPRIPERLAKGGSSTDTERDAQPGAPSEVAGTRRSTDSGRSGRENRSSRPIPHERTNPTQSHRNRLEQDRDQNSRNLRPQGKKESELGLDPLLSLIDQRNGTKKGPNVPPHERDESRRSQPRPSLSAISEEPPEADSLRSARDPRDSRNTRGDSRPRVPIPKPRLSKAKKSNSEYYSSTEASLTTSSEAHHSDVPEVRRRSQKERMSSSSRDRIREAGAQNVSARNAVPPPSDMNYSNEAPARNMNFSVPPPRMDTKPEKMVGPRERLHVPMNTGPSGGKQGTSTERSKTSSTRSLRPEEKCQQWTQNEEITHEPTVSYHMDPAEVEIKIFLDRLAHDCALIPDQPMGWPQVVEKKATVEEKDVEFRVFEEAMKLRTDKILQNLSDFEFYPDQTRRNLTASACMQRLQRLKQGDEAMMKKVDKAKTKNNETRRLNELRDRQLDGKLMLPKFGDQPYSSKSRELGKLDKLGDDNKAKTRQWMVKFFNLVEHHELSEAAAREGLLMLLQGDPGEYYGERYRKRNLQAIIDGMIANYDKTHKSSTEIKEDLNKIKRNKDETLVTFYSRIVHMLESVENTYITPSAYDLAKEDILRQKLLANLGERTHSEVYRVILDAADAREVINYEDLYVQAGKWERSNRDWGKKKDIISHLNVLRPQISEDPDPTSWEVGESPAVNSIRLDVGSADPRVEPDFETHRSRQNAYLTAHLNIAVVETINSMRRDDGEAIDSEEERKLLLDAKATMPPDDHRRGMSRELATKFWDGIPREVARFEYEVEREEKARARQDGRDTRRWRRNDNQRNIESSRTQNAWDYKHARDQVLRNPGLPAPRYSQYYPKRDQRSDNYRPRTYDNGNRRNYDNRSPERSNNQGLQRKSEDMKPKENGSFRYCDKCGTDEVEGFTKKGCPPVQVLTDSSGRMTVVPKPGVVMEMDHTAEDCPRYSRSATLPCTKCRKGQRIAFHREDDCKESDTVNVNRAKTESDKIPSGSDAPKN